MSQPLTRNPLRCMRCDGPSVVVWPPHTSICPSCIGLIGYGLSVINGQTFAVNENPRLQEVPN